MSERTILSEKLEDNKAAAEWGIKQAEFDLGIRLKKNLSLFCKEMLFDDMVTSLKGGRYE